LKKMGFNFGAGGPTSRFNHIEHNPATRAALDAVGLLKAILAAIQRGRQVLKPSLTFYAIKFHEHHRAT